MNLTKNKGMSLVVVFIILVVYNAIVFLLPFNRQGGFWVGYGFSMLAILITAIAGFYGLWQKGIKSKFYGLPQVMVVWIYLVVQILIGFVGMTLPQIPFQYGLVVNLVLLGACLIGLIGITMGKDEIKRLDEKVNEKVFYIKMLQSDVEGMLTMTSDNDLRKSIKELAETIRYSDPMISSQLFVIEKRIEDTISILTESITDVDKAKELCHELQQLFAERNRKCRLLK